jgi:hypothetical protein
MLLTTKSAADVEEYNIVRIYDISRIRLPIRNSESTELIDASQIVQIVQDMSAPPTSWFDVDGEGGRIDVLGERLIVRQSPEGHQQVADCLEQLSLSLHAAPPENRTDPAVHLPLNAIREFSPETERIAENRLHEFLRSERNPRLHFPGETPVSTILRVLSDNRIRPVLIKPDISALIEEGIKSLDDVKIMDLDLPAGQMSIGSALDAILSQTDPKLSWIVQNNIVLLTTMVVAESEENHYLRVYDVSRIRALTAASGATVFPSRESIARVVLHLTGQDCRWFETDGEGGRMVIADDQLMVRQTRQGHERVTDILEQLVLPGRKP